MDALEWEYMVTLEKTTAVLLDVDMLKAIGFIPEFGKGVLRGVTVEREIVQAESGNAFYMPHSSLLCGLPANIFNAMSLSRLAWPSFHAVLRR